MKDQLWSTNNQQNLTISSKSIKIQGFKTLSEKKKRSKQKPVVYASGLMI